MEFRWNFENLLQQEKLLLDKIRMVNSYTGM